MRTAGGRGWIDVHCDAHTMASMFDDVALVLGTASIPASSHQSIDITFEAPVYANNNPNRHGMAIIRLRMRIIETPHLVHPLFGYDSLDLFGLNTHHTDRAQSVFSVNGVSWVLQWEKVGPSMTLPYRPARLPSAYPPGIYLPACLLDGGLGNEPVSFALVPHPHHQPSPLVNVQVKAPALEPSPSLTSRVTSATLVRTPFVLDLTLRTDTQTTVFPVDAGPAVQATALQRYDGQLPQDRDQDQAAIAAALMLASVLHG